MLLVVLMWIAIEFLFLQAAVLDDCVAQLGVLGAIAPVSKEASQAMVDTVVGNEIGEVVHETRQFEREYDRLLAERQEMYHTRASEVMLKENEDAVRTIAKQLKQSTQVLVKNLKANPGDIENSAKMQGERQQVQDLLQDCRDELLVSGSVVQLAAAVADEVRQKSTIVEAITASDSSKQKAADLLVEIETVATTMEEELKDLDEELAQLKDQLQETKARVALESNYIKKETAMRVTVSNKSSTLELARLEREINELRALEAEEQKCSEELVDFLSENFDDLEEKQQIWNRKFEEDVDGKQVELETLKRDRARDLTALQELTDRYRDYDQVCKDDRQAREDARVAAQLAVRKLAATIRIQAWWRGMLVRGIPGGKKGKKGKKGKGKKSGKKKKKKK